MRKKIMVLVMAVVAAVAGSVCVIRYKKRKNV